MADVFKNLGFVEDSAPQAAPKSDPFAGLGFVEDKPAEEAPSSLEAGLRGLGQGASLGFLDEGAGALGALGDKLSGNDSSLLDLYTKHRDEERKRNDAAKAAHPYLYGGGNIAGSIGSLAVGGGALGLGKLGLVARGALEAGAMGLGDSKADLTKGEVGQSAKDTLMSASTGALMGKAGEVAAPYLQKAANNQAVRAVGAKLKDLRKMVGTDKVQEMGQALNDAGIMRPLGDAEGAYGRLADKTEDISQKIGQGVQDLDDSGAVLGRTSDIARQVKNKAASKLEDVPSGKATLDKLGNYLDNDFANKGQELITPERVAAEDAIARQQALLNSRTELQAKALDEAIEAKNKQLNSSLSAKRALLSTLPENKAKYLSEIVDHHQDELADLIARKRALLSGQTEIQAGAQSAEQQAALQAKAATNLTSPELMKPPASAEPSVDFAANAAEGNAAINKMQQAGQSTINDMSSEGQQLIAQQTAARQAEIEAMQKEGQASIEDFAKSGQKDIADYRQQAQADIANRQANLPENDRILTPKKAWEVRKGIDHDVNWNPAVKDMPDYQQGLVSTRNNLQEHLLAAAPEGGELAQNMRQYHLLESAENMAKDQTARGMSNRGISPSDYITGVGGLVSHGVPGAAAAGAINHILRTRGSQTAAWGLTNISQLLAENPQAYGKFSGPLLMAAKRGSQALAASHFVLQQSEPAYRAINEAYQNTFNQGQ